MSEHGTETEINEYGEVVFINDTDVSDSEIWKELRNSHPEVASLQRWANNSTSAARGRNKSVFEQNQYVAPQNIFDEFRLAAYAAKYDDIVSNAADTTEQLAFKRIAIEANDDNQNSIWEQILDDMNLSQRLREIWREQFIYSQLYVGVLWHRKTYAVKGKTESGNKKKQQFKDILAPRGITILDPCRVIPVGDFMFNNERLVYIADKVDVAKIDTDMLAGENTSDLVVSQLLESKYNPSSSEYQRLSTITGESDLYGRLYYLNPENCFRITATRAHYERFADVRLASIFELLDLKHILREMDRVDILSSTNCIILVKKGSDNLPANAQELAGAAAQVTQSSRIPIIVSDHRMTIEIITRQVDKVLQPDRYDGLDSRITARLYQILSTGGKAGDNSSNLFKIIASTMESRRDNIRDSIMNNILDVVFRKNDKLTNRPKMNFYPRRIALDFDGNIAMFMQDLADRGVLSPETLLAEMDILISEEMDRIKRSEEEWGDILNKYQVPYSAPRSAAAPTPQSTPKAIGRAGGGNSNGGGMNPESFLPSPPNNTNQ